MWKNSNRPMAAIAICLLATVMYGTEGCEAARTDKSAPQLAASPVASTSQEPAQSNTAPTEKVVCTLHRDQSPEVGGVRIGMTADEVLALFPGSKDDAEVRASLARPPSALGVSNLVIRAQNFDSKAKSLGIRDLTLSLLDGRVSNFTANYLSGDWSHVDEFVNKFTKGTTLPDAKSWEAYVGLDNQQKSLKCDGFEVTAFAGGKSMNVNHVAVKDLVAAKTLKDRREKARAKTPAKP